MRRGGEGPRFLRVVLSTRARSDLELIGDHIAKDSPQRAVSFVREIVAKAKSLAQSPHAFQLLQGFEAQGVRRRIHGPYLILYVVGANRIEIVRVVHGAQDIAAALFSES